MYLVVFLFLVYFKLLEYTEATSSIFLDIIMFSGQLQPVNDVRVSSSFIKTCGSH